MATKAVSKEKRTTARYDDMEKYFRISVHAFYVRKQMEDCVSFSKRCLNIAENVNDISYMIKSSHLLMLAYRDLQDDNAAILYGEKCVDLSHVVGEQEIEIEMHACFVVGKLYFGKSEYEKAVVVSEKGLRRSIELGDDKYQSMIYLLLQDCYLHLEKYQDSLKLGEKCQKACRTAKDTDGECHSYLFQSKAYQALNQLEDSINARLKAGDVASHSGVAELEVTTHFETGKVLFEQGNNLEAITQFKKALDAIEKNGLNGQNSMHAHMALSNCYLNLGNDSTALTHGLKCLSLANQHGNRHAEVDVLMIIAKVFKSMNRYSQALLNINKAVSITEEAELSEIHKHHDELYFEQGMIYKKLLRYQDAIKSLQKCLAAAKKKGDKEYEKKSYFYIGNSYEFMNKFEEAIEYYHKYMEISREEGNEVDILEAYLALGVAHLGLDQYDRAYSYLMDGKKKATQCKNEFLLKQFHHHLDDFKKQIGIHTGPHSAEPEEVIASIGKVALAKTASIVEPDDGNKNEFDNERRIETQLFKMCADFKKKGQLDEAIIYMRKYLYELDKHPHYHAREKVFCILEISGMHAELHNFDKALQCGNEGLEIANTVDSSSLKAKCHLQLGQIYYRASQLHKAIESHKKSLYFVEKMMINSGTHDQEDDFKIALLELHSQSFKGLELSYIHNKQLEEALMVSDRSRAKSLKDLLQKYGMYESTSVEEDLQFNHIQDLSANSNCAIVLYSTNQCDRCDGFYTYRVDNKNGLLFSAEAHRHDSPIKEILAKALFLEVKVDAISTHSENRSLDEDPPNTKQTSGSTDQTQQASTKKDLSGACSEKKPTTSQKKPKAKNRKSHLTTLHELLLDNCMLSIKDGKVVFSHGCAISEDEIVFVPDSFLFMVPFAALKDPRTGRYLCETKRIRLAPSISTLKLLSDRPRQLDSKSKPLIVGNPCVGRVIENGKEREFTSLVMAEIEAIAISNLFNAKPLTKEQATKSAVLEKLSQGVSVVHIAAHADDKKAVIVLAPSAEIRAAKLPEEEDYMLTMADIQKTQIRAQLVVLSCCHSGCGEIKAEGVIGMCRAFLAAGARAVVGSLWSISDDATREFMIQFYQNLKEEKSASLSLQLAMKYMMKYREYSAPKYWAPFFLIGDDVTLNF